MAQIATCQAASTPEEYLALAERHHIGLTIVGPEAPLVAGIVDQFRADNRLILGPTRSAAQLEGSKAFAKEFLNRHNIPTARHQTICSAEEGREALRSFDLPVVLKADGLAGGKGVVIAETAEEALHALDRLMAHQRVVIEEYLAGEELSFIALSDGSRVMAFPPSQDHKRLLDGDQGPNTGGMGAYSDSRLLAPADAKRILNNIVYPTISGMAEEGNPFTGFLYVGLMITSDGPKVLEFNVRLGDPEAQVLLYRISSDTLFDALLSAAKGDLSQAALNVDPDPALCVVMAAQGYPESPRVGDKITGIDAAEQTGVQVFQAGTRRVNDHLETAGGRVLSVTGSGATLADARDKVYAAIPYIQFAGAQYRKDIGARGLRRYND